MDLAALCDLGGANGTDGHHLVVYSVDVTFGCNFMATHLPSHSIGVLVVLATPVKVSRKAGNSASYPPNIW